MATDEKVKLQHGKGVQGVKVWLPTGAISITNKTMVLLCSPQIAPCSNHNDAVVLLMFPLLIGVEASPGSNWVA
eukprot:6364571-Amphidinium_carterae.1